MTDPEPLRMESSETQSLLDKKTSREMLKVKFIYVFYFGAAASLVAYLPVYYRQLGMSELETGILVSIKPFVTFISSPLWGAIADRTGKHRLILLLAIVVGTIFTAALYPFSLLTDTVSPGALTNHTLNLTTLNNMSAANLVSGSSRLTREAIFGLLFFLSAVAFFFMATISPIIDATVVTITTSDNYGKQRLWGAVGFGVCGLLSGIAANGGKLTAGVDEQANFLPPFLLFVSLNVLVFIVCFKMKTVEGRKPSLIVFSHVITLLKNPRVLLFMGVVLIIGMSSGVITWFLFLFLKDIGGSQSLMGLSIAVYCTSEVLVFLVSGQIIKYLGNSKVLYVSLLCFIIRLTSYSYLSNPWLVLPIELLHGFTYAAMWSSCVAYGTLISPPEIVTTVIGILNGIHYGLGWGLGGALGGLVYQYFGPRVLFRACAVMCGAGAVLQFLTEITLRSTAH